MDNKKRYKSAVRILVALSFILIAAICAMMWGRSVAAFPLIRLVIFIALIVVEAVTVTAEFICAAKLGRLNRAGQEEAENREEQPADRGEHKDRGTWLAIIGILASCVLAVCGSFLGGMLPRRIIKLVLSLCIVLDLIPAVPLTVSVIKAKRFRSEMQAPDLAGWQEKFAEYSQITDEAAEDMLFEADTFIHRSDVCAVAVGAMGAAASMLAGMSLSAGTAALFAVSAMWVVAGLSRLRLPQRGDNSQLLASAVGEEELPGLYALARQAQNAVGVEGELMISLGTDCAAGAVMLDDVCALKLGAVLLGIMTEAELYTVLLHEFEHLASTSEEELFIRDFELWRTSGVNKSAFSPFADLLYKYNDERFAFEFRLCDLACSLLNESAADGAMVRCGDALVAESAIRKLKYHELYEWEEAFSDFDVYYKTEEPDREHISKQIDDFLRKMDGRRESWDEITEREILAPGANHPTAKMRIEAIRSYTEEAPDAAENEASAQEETASYFDMSDPDESREYRLDCARAIALAQDILTETVSEGYEYWREESYLKPLALTEEWEQAGRPLGEDHDDVIAALLNTGRATEALGLCDRAMSGLSETASNYARFIKASALLHSYDARGVELMYKAVEYNGDFIDGGTEHLGRFLCYTGSGEELAVYREKAVGLAEAHKKKLDELMVLRRTDELVPDPMSDEMLDEILECVLNEDEYEAIKRLYLIRKIISEDFFTSVFIMQFVPGTDDEVKQYLLQRAFCCLDARDEQYSLFDWDEVRDIRLEDIENSLVFERPDEEAPADYGYEEAPELVEYAEYPEEYNEE